MPGSVHIPAARGPAAYFRAFGSRYPVCPDEIEMLARRRCCHPETKSLKCVAGCCQQPSLHRRGQTSRARDGVRRAAAARGGLGGGGGGAWRVGAAGAARRAHGRRAGGAGAPFARAWRGAPRESKGRPLAPSQRPRGAFAAPRPGWCLQRVTRVAGTRQSNPGRRRGPAGAEDPGRGSRLRPGLDASQPGLHLRGRAV